MLDRIREIAESAVEELNLSLYDVEYKGSGPRSILRVFIDKPSGVTVDECARISGRVSSKLDIEGLIPHRYTLEVSSPGLNRSLKTEKHFKSAVGKLVKIHLLKELVRGRLKDFKNGILIVEEEGKEHSIPFGSVERANIEMEL